MWISVARSGPGEDRNACLTQNGILEYGSAATLFAFGAGDGNRTRTVSLGRVHILPCFRVLQRYWRPQLASGDPYRPGLVARVWPGSLGSRVENRALAQSSLAEDHRDLTECLTTEDVRRPLSPFDARFPVITAGGWHTWRRAVQVSPKTACPRDELRGFPDRNTRPHGALIPPR